MSPKKAKKWNGYSCFLVKRKAQLQKEGVDIKGGLAEVASYVAEEWEALSAGEKRDYKLKADEWNQQNGFGRGSTEVRTVENENRWEGGPVGSSVDRIIGASSASQTSESEAVTKPKRRYMVQWESLIGNEERNIPLQLPPKGYDVSKELRLQVDKELFMMKEIRASFYAKSPSSSPEETPLPYNKHFLVIHFGNYYTNYLGAHPAEFCIADFSVRDGINNCFSRMIDPGAIPFGFQTEFRSAAKTKGYELPGFDPSIEYDSECLDVIQLLMEKYNAREGEVGVLYTIRTEIENVSACLEFVAKKTGRSFRCKIYPLSRLIELLLIEGDHLRGLNKMKTSNITFSEEDAISMLSREGFDYIPEVACNFHNCPSKVDTLSFCSMNLVKRWIYNCLPLLSRLFCCPMFLHNHVPKYDKKGFAYIAKSGGFEETQPLDENTRLWTKAMSLASGLSRSDVDMQLPGSRSETPKSLNFIGGESNATAASPEPTFNFSGRGSQATGGAETPLPLSQVLGGSGAVSEGVGTRRSSTGLGSVHSLLFLEEGKVQRFPFTTHHEFPKLAESLEVCMRAMEVKKMPEMSQREFPSEAGITWTIVNDNSRPCEGEGKAEESLRQKMTLMSLEEKEAWDFDLADLKAKYYQGQIDNNGMLRFCATCHSKYGCREERCFSSKAEGTISDSEDDDEFVGNCDDPKLRRLLIRRVTRHTQSLIPGTSRWMKYQKLLEGIEGPSAFVANGEIYSDALVVFKFEAKSISTDFNVNPNRRKGKSIESESIGGSGDVLTSVSHTRPQVIDPKVLGALQQAEKILKHGVLPTMRRPGSDSLFWDTDDKIRKSSGRGNAPLSANVSETHYAYRLGIPAQSTHAHRYPGPVEGLASQIPILHEDEDEEEESCEEEARYPPAKLGKYGEREDAFEKESESPILTNTDIYDASTIGSTSTKSYSKRAPIGRGESAALFWEEERRREAGLPRQPQGEAPSGWTPSKMPQWRSNSSGLEHL